MQIMDTLYVFCSVHSESVSTRVHACACVYVRVCVCVCVRVCVCVCVVTIVLSMCVAKAGDYWQLVVLMFRGGSQVLHHITDLLPKE